MVMWLPGSPSSLFLFGSLSFGVLVFGCLVCVL